MKMSHPEHAHDSTAKGTLRLRDYTVSSVDCDRLQCVLSSHTGGRELHIAQFNPENDAMIAAITARDREDFLMFISALQSLVEVVVAADRDSDKDRDREDRKKEQQRTRRDALAFRCEKEHEKKAQAYQEAEYYERQTQAAQAHLEDVQQQIQQHAGDGRRKSAGSRMRSGSGVADMEHRGDTVRLSPVPRQSPRQVYLDRHRDASLLELPAWARRHRDTETERQRDTTQHHLVPAPLPRRPPVRPLVPPSAAASHTIDPLETFEVAFGAETAHNLGICCGMGFVPLFLSLSLTLSLPLSLSLSLSLILILMLTLSLSLKDCGLEPALNFPNTAAVLSISCGWMMAAMAPQNPVER